MTDKGWIKLHRKFDESDIIRKPPHFREVWLYLLRQANHKDNDSIGIKRGQLYRTYKQIADDLHWFEGFIKRSYTKHQIEKAMVFLREATMIETRKTTRGMLITVCKYGSYQAVTETESDTAGKREQKHSLRYKQECSKNEKNESVNTPEIFDLTNPDEASKVYDEMTIEQTAMRYRLSKKDVSKSIEKVIDIRINGGSHLGTAAQHRSGLNLYLNKHAETIKPPKPDMTCR